jgi:hypothetical protein
MDTGRSVNNRTALPLDNRGQIPGQLDIDGSDGKVHHNQQGAPSRGNDRVRDLVNRKLREQQTKGNNAVSGRNT